MHPVTIVLLVILVILIGLLVGLYFFGKKTQKKQEEQPVSYTHLIQKRAAIKEAEPRAISNSALMRIISDLFIFSSFRVNDIELNIFDI